MRRVGLAAMMVAMVGSAGAQTVCAVRAYGAKGGRGQ